MSPQSKNRKGVKPRGGGRPGGFGGGPPNVQQLMLQAQRVQAQMDEAQAALAEQNVTGTAGGGMVTATMTGAGELTDIVIDPRAVDPDDVETLQDLVLAAVRDAARAAEELSEETMAPISGGAGLPGL